MTAAPLIGRLRGDPEVGQEGRQSLPPAQCEPPPTAAQRKPVQGRLLALPPDTVDPAEGSAHHEV
ncbi:hypothetical protein ABLE92_03410 [Gordonia sp. VNQ95]|uniref:hypothetical protein n=1 Tax=Gordonia sp. VNQ95 TaxID=3156619 RepID=UPI0032B59A49